jgi:hypothetical protein
MSVEPITVSLSGYDLIMPKLYVKCILYFPLKPDADPDKVYWRLQAGPSRTFDKIPTLDGKIFLRPEHEPGWKKGHLQISYPKNRNLLPSEERKRPGQFSFRDRSHVLPSYEDLRNAGFEFSAFKDEVVLEAPWFPPLPADVFIAQANLIEGGLLSRGGASSLRFRCHRSRYSDKSLGRLLQERGTGFYGVLHLAASPELRSGYS